LHATDVVMLHDANNGGGRSKGAIPYTMIVAAMTQVGENLGSSCTGGDEDDDLVADLGGEEEVWGTVYDLDTEGLITCKTKWECNPQGGKREREGDELRGIEPMASEAHSTCLASEKSGIVKELFWLATSESVGGLNPEKITKFR
jgi:hypothetical protein